MVTEAGLKHLRESEGLRLKAYPDPASGGAPWTIGYGRAHGVREGDTCTEEHAEQWLLEDVAEAEDAVNRYVKVPLTQGQRDALISFVFNLGAARFAVSTLLRKLNIGDYEGAADEFGKWVYGGGKVMPGLVKRRNAEKAMFTLDEPADNNAPLERPLFSTPSENNVDPINAPQGEAMDPLTFAVAALPAFLKAAPELTRIFGHSENAERNAKALEVVGQIAVEATGSPNVQDAAEQVSRSPEQAKRFQEAVQDRWFELESAREKSVAAAREFNNVREQIKDVRTVLHTGLTFIELLSLILVFVSVAGAVSALVWGGLDNQMKGAIVTLMLIAGYTGVREFWFGGSRLDEARKAEKE